MSVTQYGRGGISAKVICDSTCNGVQLTTLQLRYPRFIHSEFMTHRVFSRNASSSRAIPTQKLLDQVRENPAMPIHWGVNQSGMQSEKEHSAPIMDQSNDYDWFLSPQYWSREAWWKKAAESAASYAEELHKAGYHKQIVNRILEPFLFIDVIVTSTEWNNFFQLRLHQDAQPEIQELARCIHMAIYNKDQNPRQLHLSDWDWDWGPYWHLPYVDESERVTPRQDAMVSAARCARVSYLNHDQTEPDREKDLELATKLLDAGHMSPFEHQATVIPNCHVQSNFNPTWYQHRKMLERERELINDLKQRFTR